LFHAGGERREINRAVDGAINRRKTDQHAEAQRLRNNQGLLAPAGVNGVPFLQFDGLQLATSLARPDPSFAHVPAGQVPVASGLCADAGTQQAKASKKAIVTLNIRQFLVDAAPAQ
jgi:hypothetical protein